MRQLQQATFAMRCPMQAVTFVENPDTDTDGFATVVFNKRQGYFWILTTYGYPCVYYKDWSTDPGCYGLAADVDNYVWIHEHLAAGDLWWRWADYQAAVYERQGWPGLLCGINNDMNGGWRLITVQTSFGPNVRLHDYTGHAADVWTDGAGRVTVGLPPNDNGGGTVAYSRVGLGRANVVGSHRTTQAFEGAANLDIGPAVAGASVTVGSIWVAAGSVVTVKGTPASVAFRLVRDGEPFPLDDHHQTTTAAAGRYDVVARGTAAAATPFRVAVTFQAPQTLEEP